MKAEVLGLDLLGIDLEQLMLEASVAVQMKHFCPTMRRAALHTLDVNRVATSYLHPYQRLPIFSSAIQHGFTYELD
jgi:hypothetical protein